MVFWYIGSAFTSYFHHNNNKGGSPKFGRIYIFYCVKLYAACDADFSNGSFWNTSRRDISRTQLCSTLHPNFLSGVNIERRCENDGTWSPIDLSNCTMFMDSLPVVIVSFTVAINNTETVDTGSTLIINNVSGVILFAQYMLRNSVGHESTSR